VMTKHARRSDNHETGMVLIMQPADRFGEVPCPRAISRDRSKARLFGRGCVLFRPSKVLPIEGHHLRADEG